jgi:hypothetical protein
MNTVRGIESYDIENRLVQKSGHSMLMDVRLILSHRKALNYLRKIEVEDYSDVHKEEFTREKHFLIYAQYQPEATSFPLGGRFFDHLEIVMKIRGKYPDAIILYKEHPHIGIYSFGSNPSRIGGWRSVQYYRRLEELGCTFISKDVSLELSNALDEKCIGITMSGTVGLERALKGFATLVTGYPWYRRMPLIISFEDFLERGFLPEPHPEDLENSKRWIEDVLVHNSLGTPIWQDAKLKGSNDYYHDLIQLFKVLSK